MKDKLKRGESMGRRPCRSDCAFGEMMKQIDGIPTVLSDARLPCSDLRVHPDRPL